MSRTAVSLEKVGTGLGLVYAGLCLTVFAIVFVPLLGGLVAGPANLRTVFIVAGLLMVSGIVLDMVGRLFCLAMPAEHSGAKTIILLAVIFALIALALSLAGLAQFFIAGFFLPPALTLAQTPLSITGSVLFVIFLRMVALYIRREDLARRAIVVLTLGGVLLALLMGIFAMAFLGVLRGVQGGVAPVGGAAAGVGALGLVTLVVGLVELVLYGNLLTYLRKACHEEAVTLLKIDNSVGPDRETE